MKHKITLNNIKQYIEGNANMLLTELGSKPDYYKQQIAYRALKCSDCWINRECQQCGCSLPGKWYVDKSCNNGQKFPDIMNEQDWIKFKSDNNIE